MLQPHKSLGLKRFVIRFKPDTGLKSSWEIIARNQKQAWAKFVASQFRGVALKPNPQDFTVTVIE